MTQQVQFIGFNVEQAKAFMREVVISCLQEYSTNAVFLTESPITIAQACKIVGVSVPTLRKYVALSLIRRHDIGPRKKVFYKSELDEDIKQLKFARETKKSA